MLSLHIFNTKNWLNMNTILKYFLIIVDIDFFPSIYVEIIHEYASWLLIVCIKI